MIDNKKTSMLLILKILEEYTDENHCLFYNQISELLEKKYNVFLERKAIASSIQNLIDLDYDIEKISHRGVYLRTRTFEKSEITFLIDAIFSSKAINGKNARKLADKVSGLLSINDRKSYKYLYKTTEVNRTNNADVFLNIEIINEAISKNKKIGFQYLTYDKNGDPITRMNGFEYIVSPYYLINNYGRYYLLCNYRSKYQLLQNFRVDYMKNINIKEDNDLKPLKSLDKSLESFTISKYLNEHIYLFGGDSVRVKLLLNDSNAIGYVYDWFGSNVSIKVDKETGDIITSLVSNENALIYWLLQYGDFVKVLEPLELKEKVKEKARKILED